MSKRVVMVLTNWSQNLSNVRKFLDQAESLGAGQNAKIHYAVDSKGQPCFYVELPRTAAEELERQRTPKPPSKAQQAVLDQLKAREKKVKAGIPVSGHVKPVIRNGKLVIQVTTKKKKAP